MKQFAKLTIATLFFCAFASCKKEDHAKSSKTYFLKKRSYDDGTSTWSMEYTYDANDKITTYNYTSPNTPSNNYTITYLRDGNGKVTRYNYSYASGTSGYGTYQFNADGKVSREDVYNGTSPTHYFVYTYNIDNYEIATYSSTGAYYGKNVYYYTSDNKNIASKKSYSSTNTLTAETIFTYTNYLNVLNAYPESEIQKNYIGFVSQNAQATQTTSYTNNSAPNSINSSYTTNADGYIITSKSVSTNGTTTYTTNGTVEYIVK